MGIKITTWNVLGAIAILGTMATYSLAHTWQVLGGETSQRTGRVRVQTGGNDARVYGLMRMYDEKENLVASKMAMPSETEVIFQLPEGRYHLETLFQRCRWKGLPIFCNITDVTPRIIDVPFLLTDKVSLTVDMYFPGDIAP